MTEEALKKLGKFLLYTILIFLLLYVAYLLSDLLLILAISILLSLIFQPFVLLLQKSGFNRFTSTFTVFISVGLLFFLFLSLFIPTLLVQMNQLIETFRGYSLHDQVISVEKEIYTYLPFFNPGQLTQKVEDFINLQLVHSFDRITTLLSSIVSVIAILIIVPFITFFLLKDNRFIIRGVLKAVPNKYFEMSYFIFKKVNMQLGRYVRAWIFDAAFVGLCLGIGLYIIGIKNALPLGVIAALGHLIPYFGPLIGGIPAIIISIIQYGDLSHVPFIVILILGIYTLDNGFVQPYVFSKSVDMHPLMIIILLLIGGSLFGIFGMLLAIPVSTVVKTAAKEIYYGFKNYKIAKL